MAQSGFGFLFTNVSNCYGRCGGQLSVRPFVLIAFLLSNLIILFSLKDVFEPLLGQSLLTETRVRASISQHPLITSKTLFVPRKTYDLTNLVSRGSKLLGLSHARPGRFINAVIHL